jgi:hypothetical protein
MIEPLDHHVTSVRDNDNSINSHSISIRDAFYPGGGLQAIRESRETLTVHRQGKEAKLPEGTVPSPRKLMFDQGEQFNMSITVTPQFEELLKRLAEVADDAEEMLIPEYKEAVLAPIVLLPVDRPNRSKRSRRAKAVDSCF